MNILEIVNYFLGKDGKKKLNCAQSIIAGFKDRFSFLSDDSIKQFENFGGGKAPEGMCGALYAAKYILDKFKPEESNKIIEIFIQSGGSTKCQEIRKNKKISCIDCLKQSAEFLNQVLNLTKK